eukprot:CAMPEP_0119103538 /NCGR_PEP_ID=MMETSP1180-20130426/1956_1 /TAXON_ID=3052 ORGANISM="Chlamydomonas cf sp, Strain CCMP681" /NCGR_SAMPLE_ID=MMETSP1180 /ASSEMBLY_ACC=CAM_ASM_000741 /LENGTH=608 /DNA_ID=CAMNT_0007088073 /DNA_START=1 /DNA_END=1827 /DNA_ORIENTATION=-
MQQGSQARLGRSTTRQGSFVRANSLTSRGRRACVLVRAADPGARQPWDFGRFVSTVAYFNEDAVRKSVQGLVDGAARVISGKAEPAKSVVSMPVLPSAGAVVGPLNPLIPVPLRVEGTILVTGATGGMGRRVVSKLLLAGKKVRALVRDVDKAKQLLSGLPCGPGGELQVVAADLSQARTLVPEMFTDVRACVSCAAVKIQPKEGDNSERSKYMQGIQFFDPEVADNSPEAVELTGMRNLLAALGPRLGLLQGLPLLQGDGRGQAWGPLDDVVMGGLSISRIAPGAGEDGKPAMVFSGTVSVGNSGGFGSVRCRNFDPPLDLAAFAGMELRLKGNGLRYKAIVRPDSNWDGTAYCHSFDTRDGEWQTIRIPWSEFFPVFRAKRVKDGSPLDGTMVSSVQIMLSKFEYDGGLNPAFKAGDFELPISHIQAYMPETAKITPTFVHVSSAGVTRPERPGIIVEQEPPAVRMNKELGGLLDFKLAGEDAIRASGVPHTIVRPTALTEEPRGMPLQFDQGDTIKGKIGRDDVAELCVALLTVPSAVGVTLEVKSTVAFSSPWTVDPAAPPPARDWAEELIKADLKPGVTGKTINGKYTGKEPEEKFVKQSAMV